MKNNVQLYKSTDLHTIDDIIYAFKKAVAHGKIYVSGHKVRNGEEYAELRNVVFKANRDFIIDAPEYPELESGVWYEKNYIPKMTDQILKVLDMLVKNTDTRHAIISLYDKDKELENDDMICTIYISLRLDKLTDDSYLLSYTVHMRSSDVREYRSDIKFHKKILHEFALKLQEMLGKIVIENNIVWYADSLQFWDKDWEYLIKKV